MKTRYFYITRLFILCAVALLFVLPNHAQAASLYFNNAVNNSWDTLGNWWQDANHTIPALATPGPSDDAYIHEGVGVGPAAPTTVTNLIVGSTNNNVSFGFNGGVEITVTGLATFGIEGDITAISSNFALITGNALFHFNNSNGQNPAGEITGDATFNEGSSNLGTVGGNALFNDNANNGGEVGGIAKFTIAAGGTITIEDGYSWGDGTAGSVVGGDDIPITHWIFDGESTNQGIISGTPIFNDISSNNGSVTGNAIFNDSSINSGTVSGDAEFNDASTNSDEVTGIAKFTYATGGTITIPAGATWRQGIAGSVVGNDNNPITNWIFNGDSLNNGEFEGTATFNDTSINDSTITGDVTFNDSSHNQQPVIGTATFNDTSNNTSHGTVTGAIFNDSSFNQANVENATFNDTSYNLSNITGEIIFNDQSYNQSSIQGNATFNGTSLNDVDGTVEGDATFGCHATNNGTVTGTITILTCDENNNSSSQSSSSGGGGSGFAPPPGPPPVSPSTPVSPEDVKKQLEIVFKKIYELQAMIAPTALSTTRDLVLGAKGKDVESLQKFLIKNKVGPASEALAETGVTGYFGPLTVSALAEFQESIGMNPHSGSFGPKTRAYLKSKGY